MEQFGPYTLVQRIGAGGMCEVFRARRQGVDHEVALKRLHPHMQDQSAALDLFLTEADVGVMLSHPNLVNSLESDEVQGRYYIAMELIDGMDLAKLMRLGRDHGLVLDEPLSIFVVTQLCAGLHYLHNACSPRGHHFGIVHRDVSPDNVFVTRQGEVKLADFGIAKVGRLESVTTLLGGVKGKVAYMAPEQIRGETLDPRTDLFSAALILYELLTGVQPYGQKDGESEVEQALRVRDADIVPMGKLEPDLPAELDQALRQALHKRPKKRFANCEELAFELDNIAIAKGWNRGPQDLADYFNRLQIQVGKQA